MGLRMVRRHRRDVLLSLLDLRLGGGQWAGQFTPLGTVFRPQHVARHLLHGQLLIGFLS